MVKYEKKRIFMELYHYTKTEHLSSIKEKGLLKEYYDNSTLRINTYLKQFLTKEGKVSLREQFILFYNIPQYEEEELPEGVLEIIVPIDKLSKPKLYIANRKHAEMLYRYLKIKDKDSVKEELKYYSEAYINSIKQYEAEEDLYLYENVECFYADDVSSSILLFNTL